MAEMPSEKTAPVTALGFIGIMTHARCARVRARVSRGQAGSRGARLNAGFKRLAVVWARRRKTNARPLEATGRYPKRDFALIDSHESAAQTCSHCDGRSAAGVWVKHNVSLVAQSANEALEKSLRFLRRVACALS